MPKSFLRFLPIGVALSSLLFVSACSSGKLYRRAVAAKPYDVIIVPGVPFNGKDWDFKMKGRVIWANYLIKQGITKYVIFSGGAVYTPYVEAKVMALYAQALGTPKDCIFTEEKAEHSTENVYYSYLMAKKLGFTKIALATDPYQSNMLKGFIKAHQLPVVRIPFRIKILMKIDNVHPVIDATPAKAEHFRSIKETQSRKYRRNGTRGKNIVFETQ
jgi:hypothetical protein